MKVSSSYLNNILNLVKPVANGRIMPILGSVKLDVVDDKLTVIASNSEMQIETSCSVSGTGIVGCIDADKLDKFIKSSSGDINIDIAENKALLKGKSRSTVNVLSVNDFPEMRVDLDKSISVKMSANDLALAFDSVSHCVAINDVRSFLNGISFKLANGELTIVGSDGFRLSTITLPVNVQNDITIECIIPIKTAQTISKTFKNGDIELRLNKGSLSVTDGLTTIIGKNIDAKFPDFGRVLNVNRTNHLVINRADLVSGIESVLLTATDLVKRVSLKFSENNINMVCRNAQGEESESDVQCEYIGDEFEFGFNADYLIASAKKVDGTLNLNWLDGSSVLLTGSDENILHIVMPINI